MGRPPEPSGARHDPRQARLRLLPHALRVAVVVEVAECQHHRRQPRHAAHLARSQDAVRVHHLVGRHGLAENPAARVQHVDAARVVVVKPVRLALAEQIELHALNDVPGGDPHRAGDVQVVALQHLQLEGHAEIVLRQPRPEPDDAVSALRGRPNDERLHAVEIQLAARIAVLRKVRPLPVDDRVERRGARLGLRHDPGADRVANQFRDRLAGIRVVAQQVARAVSQ